MPRPQISNIDVHCDLSVRKNLHPRGGSIPNARPHEPLHLRDRSRLALHGGCERLKYGNRHPGIEQLKRVGGISGAPKICWELVRRRCIGWIGLSRLCQPGDLRTGGLVARIAEPAETRPKHVRRCVTPSESEDHTRDTEERGPSPLLRLPWRGNGCPGLVSIQRRVLSGSYD